MSAPASTEAGQARRAVLASMIGTTVEYYDFLVYGVAASLVFGKLFFPQVSPTAGVLLSLSTFAIAFIMRPVGAALFGHLGDRLGRKRVLFWTIMIMGVGTVAIGLLPTYDTIGVLAPILLVLCRLVQGLALGGEQAGGWVMSIESSKGSRRSFAGAFVQSGAGWGLLLANLLFLVLTQMSDDAFLSWGWRVPFLLSAALVAVGVYIRLKLEESPEFTQVEDSHARSSAPLVDAFRLGWRQIVLVTLSVLAVAVNFYVATVYSITYGTTALGEPRTTILSIMLIMTGVFIIATPMFGVLGDRIGTKKVFVASAATLVVAPFVFYWLFSTLNYPLMVIGYLVLFLAVSANMATLPAFFASAFPTTIRFTGIAISYNLGAVLGGSFAPLISAALLSATGSWVAVAAYNGGAALIAVIAAVALREIRHGADGVATVAAAHGEAITVEAVAGTKTD